MSFSGNIFSKFGFGDGHMTSLLPQYVPPSSRSLHEHDLSELSPRPEGAFLASPVSDSTHKRASSSIVHRNGDPIHVQNKRNGAKVKASVTFQEPSLLPGRTGDGVEDCSAGGRSYQHSEQSPHMPGIWRPSLPPELRSNAGTMSSQLPFFESMFASRPSYSRTSSTHVDHSFKLIERRENQMQQELQQLLDAQDYALEKHLANTAPDDDTPRQAKASSSNTPTEHVVPVRQPKKRHLSKREARLGISRCMSQLSDLKNEEEAYIATALAERKAALSKLRNLSTKRSSIMAEMEAIESDRDQPFKNQIEKMEQQHVTVCEDIAKLEEKLRDLRRTKAKLESRIAEAKSTRDSELSGYKGALNECDKCINDFTTYPEVSVLEMEGLLAKNADLRALLEQHISGMEFWSLRPERRTLPMAKDWWEGEVKVLEQRKVTVDKERAALDEGTQLWQDILAHLDHHDRHLKLTFEVLSKYSSSKNQTTQFDGEMGEILKNQYGLCKKTIRELVELHDYAEGKGWKLLVTALSAEIHYFHGLKQQLGDTLVFVGWADGVVTPQPGTPSHNDARNGGNDLLSEGHHDAEAAPGGVDVEDELAGSFIRHWNATDELQGSLSQHDDTLRATDGHDGGEDSDRDNEVPQGLLHEPRNEHESDDERNEVPPEFLSMHSPSPESRDKGKVKMVASEKEAEHRRDDDDDDEAHHHPLSRESSANEIPPDLLDESPYS